MTKGIHLVLAALFLLFNNINHAQTNKAIGPNQLINLGQLQNRGCATGIPSQQWEAKFQDAISEYLKQNPQQAKMIGNNSSVMAGYSIPVIMHVIHGGQAVGTFPNLAQGQLNSQVTVLANDYGGTGQNVGNYPANAFQAYATNTLISAASKDASGRIGIANCNINFCLATMDTLGNILPEPGIHRVNYNSLPATANPSKNPAAANYNTPTLFQNFINSYIKPNTIWNVGKYLNIWVTDENASVGLLGYATFPPLSTLAGIPGPPYGTATTDGFWSYAGSFGSSTIFPGGTYSAPYDKGRTCTHEIGHWLGLRHTGGDVTNGCATDYCNDTPPSRGCNSPCGNGFGLNFGSPTYPFHANQCAGPPANVDGDMFMNFMDYTDDLAMYMFTADQRVRMHVAMQNSPYRKFLGTHGLCNLPPPLSNFTVAPNPVCQGSNLLIGDLSLNIPTSWSYTMTGGTPSLSTVQNPTVSYATAGVYTIQMTSSNGAGTSTVAVKTVTVLQGPAFTLTSTPGATVCAGNNVTITPSGATTYTLLNTGATAPPFVVTPTAAIVYSVNAITTGTNTCPRTQTLSISIGSIAININPPTASVCAGSPVVLTGSGATTYTWSTGPNTSSVSVSPTVATTYTLNGTSGGCTGTKTVQVSINASPTIAVSNATICPAGTATLTASGASTYSWSTGATTSVITVSPPVNTTYTVTGTSALGCVSTKTVSVTIGTGLSLNIVASPTAICSGASSTLTASGATTYTWNTGANGANLVVTPSVTTNYTVNGTSGTCSGTQTISLLVNPNPTITPTSSSASVCAGNSATLSATGATTYTWNPGNLSGASVVVTPSSATIYTVVGTNASGCSNTKTISVAVNTLPVVNVSASPAAVCAGSSSTLTATGATTYSWSTGGTGANIAVTPTGPSTYTVTGTTNGCSSSNTVNVTVNPTPTVAVSNATICVGGTATLTASGATTYSWSTAATTSVITVSPASNTTYTVTGSSLGCTNTKTVSVTIGTALSINVSANPASICAGGSTTLTATGATTYTWNTLATTAAIVASPSVATTYTVVGTSGTCSGSNTISVAVNANPAVTAITAASIICTGSPVNLTAGGATNYTWSTGATTSVIAVTPSVTTSYTVTGSNGTCSSSAIVTQSVSACTGLSQVAKANYDVVVYPNPFKEELTISAG
jgi:PKD repeat protein